MANNNNNNNLEDNQSKSNRNYYHKGDIFNQLYYLQSTYSGSQMRKGRTRFSTCHMHKLT